MDLFFFLILFSPACRAAFLKVCAQTGMSPNRSFSFHVTLGWEGDWGVSRKSIEGGLDTQD